MPLSLSEKIVAQGLVQMYGAQFSMGYFVLKSETLEWRAAAGGSLLKAIESCSSFKTEGSAAQSLYGKVLRIHQHHVN